MRTFPKHEGKKKRPARREHSEMKFLILQGVFLFYFNLVGRFLFYSAALIFDMLNAETLPSGETVELILKRFVFFVPSVS
mgnify:CR=1 FL=1